MKKGSARGNAAGEGGPLVRSHPSVYDNLDGLSKPQLELLGYLRTYGIRTFAANPDGPSVRDLISKGHIKGLIRIASTQVRRDHPRFTPLTIADRLWQEMKSRPSKFPYETRRGGPLSPGK
jgi:hypothetical protein